MMALIGVFFNCYLSASARLRRQNPINDDPGAVWGRSMQRRPRLRFALWGLHFDEACGIVGENNLGTGQWTWSSAPGATS
jgi:hypothetical protein